LDIPSISLLIAFAAGIVSFASPCVLPLVPIYLAQLAGISFDSQRQPVGSARTFLHALSFVLGFSLIFVALGASIGLLGSRAGGQSTIVSRIAGVGLVVLGLHLAGILRIPWLYRERRFDVSLGSEHSYWRSSLIGGFFAVGWVPCIGPTLAAILTLSFSSATVGQGSLLLAVYSLGLGVPFLLAGFALGKTQRLMRRIAPHFGKIELASGALLIVAGVLVFTNSLTMLNQYFGFFSFTPPI